MEVLYPRCCGLDVLSSPLVLVFCWRRPANRKSTFAALEPPTCEVRELVAWLRQFGVEQVAMESTGVYWKPVCPMSSGLAY